METRLKYRMQSLIDEKNPRSKDVVDILFDWAHRVIPLNYQTLKGIVNKTEFSNKHLEQLKYVMVYGEEKQNLANFKRSQSEYNDSVVYLDNLLDYRMRNK
ncbi:hypothetical protein HN415_01550 [Candidatus Woesearchaeota archaeon]|jgi:hypothetical protein|nr:hypothetical protein [Candidatus Woesearchaeota archaeon]